ncbi:glycoside hydrolase [Rhizophagus irregularis]|uniref:mannan endo-1,4-beta-mannosidase n=1 Tax=Rhizophagus irregularis TaxID=588596 RepID=A0A2I1FSF3_9GLOM|nr:glycoside hydrolase [Rhizophagus irregularis]
MSTSEKPIISPANKSNIPELSSKEFIKVDGTLFKKNDKSYYIIGANYWQAMNLGAPENGNRSRVLEDLKILKKYGVNCVRIMAGSEGPNGEPYRMYPALMNSPGDYNENVFQGLDWFLAQLSQFNMTAIMVLSNYWHWSGGFAQYVNWVDPSKPIPYPVPEDYSSFELYAARFYSDSSIYSKTQSYYFEHIKSIITRNNTITSQIYKNDPNIFAWELVNEPQAIKVGNDSHNIIFKWIDDTAKFIKELDKNHLVSTGAEGKNGEEWFITMHKSPHIDFTSAHIWVENWGYYNSDDSSLENYQKAETFMLNFLQNVSDWSTQKLNKPLLVGEYGMARDAWSGASKYSPLATVINRTKYFSSLANKVFELEKQKACTGHMFWAFAGIARPSDPAPTWIGDPPHEPPGWYSIYDSDEKTLNVFAEHAKRVAELN